MTDKDMNKDGLLPEEDGAEINAAVPAEENVSQGDTGVFEVAGTDSADTSVETAEGETAAVSAETDAAASEEAVAKSAKKKALAKKIAKMGAAYPMQVALYGIYKIITWALNILLTCLLVGVIAGAVVVAAFVIYIKGNIDPNFTGLENLQFESSLTTTISYVNEAGELVEMDSLVGTENRSWASYNEMPEDLVNAFIAIEDKRFWEHPGVDYRRTGNAIINFFSSTGPDSGGSTITQQLIKNVSGDDQATIQRKVQEILRAINVTKAYSKQQVMEMYLNTIFLSQNSYGVKTAAMEYFGKELDELTVIECAALASIPKSPTKYDPVRNPHNNQERRDLVLKQMYEQGYITEEEFLDSYGAQLELNTESEEDYTETVHSYFVDALISQVREDLCAEFGYDTATANRLLYSGGLNIVTTVDPMVQASMEEVFTQTSHDYLYLAGDKVVGNQGVIPQAAMVIMDPDNGNVLGIVGGRGEKKESGFNRATQSRRQCGSSIKPLSLYTLAIEEGLITCGTAVDDVPTMKNDKDKYWPTNTPNRFYGHIDVNFAVIKSLNTIPVALVNKLTPQKCFDFLQDTLGFYSIIESEEKGGYTYTDIALAPLALGGFTHGVTVLEVTQGYCMLANGGVTSDARMYTQIKSSNGVILIDNAPKHKVAVSETSAYSMTGMLMNVVTQTGATGTRVTVDEKYDIEVAGKTGSTNDDRDRYFAAYTPDYVGAVWFGYDNNKSLTGFTGNPALCLWDRVFDSIYGKLKSGGVEYTKEFDVPTGMVKVNYCAVSGKLPCESCYRDIYYYDDSKGTFKGHAVMTGYFAIGTQPTEKCDCHIDVLYDKVTKAICFDGCACPKENLITVAFRLNNERAFDSYVAVLDGDCIYKEIPEDYVFPTSKKQPFFANLYPSGTYFGYVGGGNPRNRLCVEHYNTTPESDESSESTGG
ncbi:MAG: transglycosylase domain-containing protein [Clostridia bacterium]|nr:transglycosylase domain-containing protein [Clostridia bacterium]